MPIRSHRTHPHSHGTESAHPRSPAAPHPLPESPKHPSIKLSTFVEAVKRLSFDASQNMVLCCCRDDINDHMLAEFEQAFNIFNLQSLAALPSQGTVSYNVAGDHFKGDYVVVILPHYSSAPGTNRCGAILTAMDKLKTEKKKLDRVQQEMQELSEQQEMSAVQLLSTKFPYSAELGLLVEICRRVDPDLCHLKVDGDTQKRVCQFIVSRHLAALSNLPRHKPKRVITGILNHHNNTVEDFCDDVRIEPNQRMEVVDVLCEF